MLHRMFEGNQTSFNITQHHAIWWPKEFNMLHSTMLKYVESRCCIRLAKALYQRFLIPSISKTRTVLFGCRKIIRNNSKPLELVRWITKNDPPPTTFLLTKSIAFSFSYAPGLNMSSSCNLWYNATTILAKNTGTTL